MFRIALERCLLAAVALLFVAWSAKPSVAQNASEQAQAMRVFSQVCVRSFPDAESYASQARAIGFKQISKTQWDSKDGKHAIHFVPKGEKVAGLRRRMVRTDGQSFNLISDKRPKKPTGACYLLSQVSPQNMYAQLGKALTQNPTAKVKTRGGGNTAYVDVVQNSTKARIEVSPMRMKSVAEFTAFSIIKR